LKIKTCKWKPLSVGMYINNNHYYAFVRANENEWYKADCLGKKSGNPQEKSICVNIGEKPTIDYMRNIRMMIFEKVND